MSSRIERASQCMATPLAQNCDRAAQCVVVALARQQRAGRRLPAGTIAPCEHPAVDERVRKVQIRNRGRLFPHAKRCLRPQEIAIGRRRRRDTAAPVGKLERGRGIPGRQGTRRQKLQRLVMGAVENRPLISHLAQPGPIRDFRIMASTVRNTGVVGRSTSGNLRPTTGFWPLRHKMLRSSGGLPFLGTAAKNAYPA
jgi:hypothetical protein